MKNISETTKIDMPSNITPFFWQHGETEEILRNEIRQMHENGIDGFIVESRPHPDYLGEGWWHDIDIIIDEAKIRNMKVWFFDDCAFPSGYAAGKIRDNHPEYLKLYLDERHIDAVGPMKGSSFIIKAWLKEEEKLVNVVAAKSVDGLDGIDGESLIDLTTRISDGILYWDIPAGFWRIFIFISTRNGGEESTRDYLNPIEPEPVKAFLKYVYEEFYKKYPHEFGKTIAGFFSDEPRFGNAGTYEGRLGKMNIDAPFYQSGALYKMVLPYSEGLLSQLEQAWQGNFKLYLPCLWYDAGPITHNVRYLFMDVVSRLFGECYTKQLGDWCRQHGVKYIGHVVEDSGAHARLGYGAGHFFRAIRGQDYSGMDLVFYQVWPGFTSGKVSSPFGYLDADFFYWGITKMASSAGHIDPKKDGITVCELFGAYGWQAGLKLMKWLTDHVCVRGVNWLIPHAFSPIYPDPDCPPHFYATGANPQWRYFNIWSGYANRLCHLLSGGRHIAPVAVIYHAEAEWSGKYMPFEKVVKVLAQEQIDCDVVPIDTFVGKEAVSIKEGCLKINEEEYRAIVVPYAERLPEEFIQVLLELTENSIYVIFVNDYPMNTSFRPNKFIEILNTLKSNKFSMVCQLDLLVAMVEELNLRDIEVTSVEENLRYYHYENEQEQLYFFTNESMYNDINTTVKFKDEGIPIAYDALNNKFYILDYCIYEELVSCSLYLEPYESLFIMFVEKGNPEKYPLDKRFIPSEGDIEFKINTCWDIYAVEAENYPDFNQKVNFNSLGNVAVPGILPEFSGTLRYETEFEFEKIVSFQGKIMLDLGKAYELAEVWLNGNAVGTRICPPYYFDLTEVIVEGRNLLRIDVTNTLAKKLGNNGFDKGRMQEPSGLIGPIKIIYS